MVTKYAVLRIPAKADVEVTACIYHVYDLVGFKEAMSKKMSENKLDSFTIVNITDDAAAKESFTNTVWNKFGISTKTSSFGNTVKWDYSEGESSLLIDWFIKGLVPLKKATPMMEVSRELLVELGFVEVETLGSEEHPVHIMSDGTWKYAICGTVDTLVLPAFALDEEVTECYGMSI